MNFCVADYSLEKICVYTTSCSSKKIGRKISGLSVYMRVLSKTPKWQGSGLES
jgi:hypothetical protein